MSKFSNVNPDIYTLKPSEELKQEFIERTKKHIALVNEFASKLGKSYPDHDESKLNPEKLLDGYCYFMKPREERTKTEEDALDLVTLIHITNSPHHPEYWTDTDLTGFTRTNYTPHGPIDATDMPEEYLEEMVCDWVSMGKEKGNTAREWFNSVNGVRWIFSMEQQKFIRDTIRKLEDE